MLLQCGSIGRLSFTPARVLPSSRSHTSLFIRRPPPTPIFAFVVVYRKYVIMLDADGRKKDRTPEGIRLNNEPEY